MVDSKYFDALVLGIILISSVGIALEDAWLDTRPTLVSVLYYLNLSLTFLFLIEACLRLFGMGFVAFFTDIYCLVDTLVVAALLANFILEKLGKERIEIFQTMRILRLLRLLDVMTKFYKMKGVAKALARMVWKVAKFLVVFLIFWLVFAIFGVSTFKGKFLFLRQ